MRKSQRDFSSFRCDSSNMRKSNQWNEYVFEYEFTKNITHSNNFRKKLRIRILTTSDVRYRRIRSFCFRTCIRRELSTNTVIMNNATILESIFVMIARKHIQEFDINNDVSLFIDKRQFRCQTMTTIFDIWIRLLSNNDDDSRYLNSFISVNLVCNCETKINYYWYITFALTLKKTLLLQNNFWSNHRYETHLIEQLMWNVFDRFRCKTHLKINTKIL